MEDVEEYLRRAEHAVSMMETETDPQAKAAFERTAKTWLKLAEARVERIANQREAAASKVVKLKDEP